jgi:hypothetical protein
VIPSAARAELAARLRDRAAESRAFAELLIDCEEDRVLRAVLVSSSVSGEAADIR